MEGGGGACAVLLIVSTTFLIVKKSIVVDDLVVWGVLAECLFIYFSTCITRVTHVAESKLAYMSLRQTVPSVLWERFTGII